jgi:Amidohydrolase
MPNWTLTASQLGKTGETNPTGKAYSMRLFAMRVNVDWQEWQNYVNEAPQAASFALFVHEDELDEDDKLSVSHFRKAVWFSENDFSKSDEGFAEVRMELRFTASGEEVDASTFSLVYARGTNHYRWIFRNKKLSEIGDLWEEEEKAANDAGNDPRHNRFGLYQITQPFGKDWGGYTVHTWLLPRVPAYFDCHMHIQSNHCAPLPLVWEKLPLGETMRLGWGTMDWLSAKLFKETGRIGAMSTEDIGKEALKQLKSAVWEGVVPYNYHYATMGKVLTPLPMDMDYGHFRGYQGEPIYRKEGDTFAYRRNPFSKEEHTISWEDWKKFEDYTTQLKAHVKTTMESGGSWSSFNYYHFDPRRHQGKETWDASLKRIVSATQTGAAPFAGVKLYTSLGYRPLDPKLPVQHKLYAYCQAQGIPIMNHCTPSGMYTHEKRYFYDLLKQDPGFETDSRIEDLEATIDALMRSGTEGAAMAIAGMAQEAEALKCLWFEERYVHPKAWEPVAKAYPGLRVCLAHFTGNDRWGNKKARNGQEKKGKPYGFKPKGDAIDTAKTSDWIVSLFELIRPDNGFHADLSFFAVDKYSEEAFIDFMKWAKKSRPFLLDRILWGTDWPLLELDTDLRAPLFNTFTENLLERLNRVDKTLWFRFSLINPARFLNLKAMASNWAKVVGGATPAWVPQLPDTLDDFFKLRPKKLA